ncbi:MAG: DNA polymerase III subunit gamma/tau [Dehalococcoidales bacterium]|nr:DNA polymerase III subunit gamma/tau [Dehalococcoidales bacterium]
MASQVFYRKWRPQTLSEVVGQEQVTRTLLNALKSSRVAHAYLFCGPRGTGKTSTGRILAKAVNCLTTNGQDEPCNSCAMCQAITEGRALDVIEIDAASNTGVDNIRDLRERANYTPGEARYKVYIIDEVHMLSTSASNALLKTLEEPPPHVIFVLATTEAHKVLPTVLSRCQHFDFRRIAQADVVSRLSHICSAEGVKVKPETLRLIARSATGSLRDAENILEQLITFYGTEIGLQQAQATLGISGDRRAREMLKHIIDNDIAAGIRTIKSISGSGLDLRPFNRELVEYLRALLLIKTGTGDDIDLPGEDVAELKEIASKASLPQILKAVKLFGQLESGGFDSYSTLPLELALVDCVLTQEEPPKSQAKQTRPRAQKPAGVSAPRQVPVATEPSPPKTRAAEVSSPPPAQPEAGPSAVEAPPLSGETPVAPPEPGGEIEFLKQNWKRIIENAPADTQKTPAVAFLRSSGRPLSFSDDTVVLAFKFPIHKDNMEKPQNHQVAERIISSFMGRPCRVRCIYQPEDNHLVEAVLNMGAQIIDAEDK